MKEQDQMCSEWIKLKEQETDIKSKLLYLEAEMQNVFSVPEEGARTQGTELHKVKVTQPINRRLDKEVWESVKGNIPEEKHPIKVEVKADPTKMKQLARFSPKEWVKIAPAFITKPGKVKIEITPIE